MKFTLAWLKDHLDTTAALPQLCDMLTAIGLEVEQVNDPAEALKDFIVAEIREAAPHPNASKLQVCKVFDGAETRQIVCGAANARAGLKTVLAREGVYIPGSGITIKKTKIRDVESNGMLCSAEELGLDAKSEGILELPASATPGSPAADALGLNDPMIEINLTPNRADCLSVRGIARDLAAAGLGTLKPLSIPATIGNSPSPVTVTLETPHCPLFIGVHIKGVKNGPSPDWLQARLKAIGLRPISALVDITNYLTFTFARPLHVYDAKKLSGNITVRSAKEGETLAALNDKTYTLKPGMTAIADPSGVIGLGGIIGGASTGCDEHTTDVFLEAALFEPTNIAATGRALELQSDARYRFERGVDPAFVEPGAQLALAMIAELCGGEVSQLTIAGKTPEWKRTIPFRPSRILSLGGVEMAAEKAASILTALGCTVSPQPQQAEAFSVTPPSWRADIEGEADLVEEVLRIHGYDTIPATPLPKPAHVSRPAITAQQKRLQLVRRAASARGMQEVCSWSFLPEAQAIQFGGGQPELRLVNPISAELNWMRPSLLPNLLTAARDNAHRGIAANALFEAGAQFTGIAPDQQQTAIAGIRSGAQAAYAYPDARFTAATREADAFDAKADAFALIAELGFDPAKLTVTRDAPNWYHPGRSARFGLGKQTLGYFGELHPAILEQFDLKGRVCAFEFILSALPPAKAKAGKAKPSLTVSDFPAVERDFAFVADAALPVAELLKQVALADKQLITRVEPFDVYMGKGMEDSKKSVALRVTMQAPDRTLTDADITAAHTRILDAAAKAGAVLRQ